MIKLALVSIDNKLKDKGLDAQIINTIHDEIIVECAESDAEQANEIVKTEMQNAGKLILKDIPIKAESNIVNSWGEKA